MLSPPSLYVRPSRIAERQRPARSYTGLLVFLELQAGKRERNHDRGVHLSAHGDPLDSAREFQAQRQWLLDLVDRSEENTSELQSLIRISYAFFCLKQKKQTSKISPT